MLWLFILAMDLQNVVYIVGLNIITYWSINIIMYFAAAQHKAVSKRGVVKLRKHLWDQQNNV